ncbi:MAG: hypothetical protein H6819_12445 [Phycisphaerales bacterium]|nr:hypothetical protein [Phycisphaerales bacterium]MCB9855194.1 hypothetical protein [Phycisphaerales bacterium]MCB9862787.1 hypothetical protein [Phycisphaerales bacterium]
MIRNTHVFAIVTSCCLMLTPATALATVFFESCQAATLLDSGVTSDTISSSGYEFTYTRDKLFTGGTGQIIGRAVHVPWPDGVEAQAVTTPPPGVTDHKARMTLRRVDGNVFDWPAFTVKILANTAGAGAAIEIMPLVNGEDAFADPIAFNVTGFSGQTFSYDTSPNPWGSTALLTGYDTYKIALYVDFAMVALTLNSSVNDGACCLPDHSCVELTTSDCISQGGTSQGVGTNCGCAPCLVPLDTFVAVLVGTDTDPSHQLACDFDGSGTTDGKDIQGYVTALLQP